MAQLLDHRGNPFPTEQSRQIVAVRQKIAEVLKLRAKYDAAQTTHQNELHWQWADNLGPSSANSLAVRRKLRNRSRYETANNGYLKGIILSLCNDFVGSGPTLQITDPRFNDEQKSSIETQWLRRAKKIKLRRKLWMLRHAKAQDGEAFSVAFTNNRLKHAVKTDQKVVECDQFSTFEIDPKARNEVDGVRFDLSSGEPEAYHVLDNHPGENFFFTPATTGKWVAEENVIHWYRRDRGWLRGVPETTSTLPLWALLRRYTLAVVQNAEIAADFTVLLKSMQTPYGTGINIGSDGQPVDNSQDWFDSFPVDRGLMTVLPDHYDLSQLDPKQPVTVYDAFVNALVQEAARPLLTPRNHAIGNSGGYNMASGTHDRQNYRQAVEQEQLDCQDEVLDKDLSQWWFEAIRVPNYFEDEVSPAPVVSVVNKFAWLRMDVPDHTYRWDQVPEHTDPVKVATSVIAMHEAGHISDIDIQEGRFNRRVEEHYANLEKQTQNRERLGMPVGGIAVAPLADNDNEDRDED